MDRRNSSAVPYCPRAQCNRLFSRGAPSRAHPLRQSSGMGMDATSATGFCAAWSATGVLALPPALAGHKNGGPQRRGRPHEPARRWAPLHASAAWYAAETRQAGRWGAGGLADELWAAGGGMVASGAALLRGRSRPPLATTRGLSRHSGPIRDARRACSDAYDDPEGSDWSDCELSDELGPAPRIKWR